MKIKIGVNIFLHLYPFLYILQQQRHVDSDKLCTLMDLIGLQQYDTQGE